MDKLFLTSPEIIQATISKATTKVKSNTCKLLLLSILAGSFIAFGAHASIIVMQSLVGVDVGFAKLLGACVFPVGLMLTNLTGAELFTGNNLMTLAVYDRKISLADLLKSWLIIYIGNFIGSYLLGFMIAKTGILAGNALDLTLSTVQSKMSLTFGEAFFRGICCNILVVLAIWLATGSKDATSKMLSCFFPVMVFVLSGFEHSVANMYYFSVSHLLGFPFTWRQMALNNLLPVTLGNIVGGAVFIPLTYYLAFIKLEKSKAAESRLSVLKPVQKTSAS